MRVAGLLFSSVLLGVAAIGAWIYFGPDGALPLVDGAAQPVERSKYRFAPYVVLVPAEPAPVQPAPSPDKRKSSEATPPAAPARIVSQAPKPEPSAPEIKTEPVSSPSSDVAKQALVAILGSDKRSASALPKEKKIEAPVQALKVAEPEQPPVKEPQSVPAPESQIVAKVKPEVTTPPAPAPAVQVATADRASQKLKYEIETDRQAKAQEKQKSLLSQGTVRFRRVVPVSPGRIKANKNMITLVGVNALEADTQCTYSTGAKWDCGKWGTFALRRFIRSRSLVCELVGEISNSEFTGRCKVGGADVSKWVVRRGWGTPTQETQNAYANDLEAAKSEKLGQWSAAPKTDS